jgi:glycosyltransferase involved in cell wall biosynthesis
MPEHTSDQDLPHEDYEVVVIVDGSSDGTVEMLRGLRAPYELVIVVRGENRGLAAARNAGHLHPRSRIRSLVRRIRRFYH